ncbi:MAG: hypothetical protein KF690_11995 [Bacteroidetes bacterium]|nr:hypothetical protein [Bacteroidota bacterium]
MPPTLKRLLLICCTCWSLTASGQEALPLDSISFHGNRVTKDKALLRLMSIGPGDTLAHMPQDILTRNQELLYNTDLFNQVTFRLDTTDTGLHLHITMKERWFLWPYLFIKLEDITLADWFRNPDFYRITYSVGFFRDNLTGRLDKVRVLYGNGYKKSLMLSYNRPMLFPKAQIDGFFYLNYFRNDEVNYASDSGAVQRLRVAKAGLRQFYQGEITLSKRLNPWNWLYVRGGARQMTIADTLAAYNPTYLPQDTRTVGYPVLSVGYLHDTRDVRAFSQKGTKITLEICQSGLPSGQQPVDFLRLSAGYRHFLSPAPRWRFNYGADIQHLSGISRLPFYEKALISPELGPRGYESYFLTGTTLLDAKAELLFALSPRRIYQVNRLPGLLNALYPLAKPFIQTFPLGVYPYLFADAGYLQDRTGSGMDASFLDKMLHTVGIGLYVPYIYDNLLRLECGLNHLGRVTYQLNFTHALR